MGPLALAAGLVVYNALANRWRPFHGPAYVPLNLALLAAVLVTGTTGFGLGREALGLVWRDGWIGAALAAGAMLPVFAALAFERGRRLLRDERLAGVRGTAAVYTVAVRIPIGTALVEEVVFRGVLLGAALSAGTATAVTLSSVAFGLWHIVPTAILARTNRLRWWVVPTGVVGTGVAGAFLAWLRIETGSVAAPFLLHALVNSLGAVAALVALSVSDDR